MEVNREQLAWATGLFEGEGCFTSWSGYGKRYLQSILSSTDEDVVRKFHSIIGIGTVHGPFLKGHNKPFWRWRVSSFEDNQAVIAMLWNWLGSRRKARATEVLKLYHSAGRRYGIPTNEVYRLIELGLTQDAIANKLGCTQANISYIVTHPKKSN